MEPDIELGRIHHRQYVHGQDRNNTLPSTMTMAPHQQTTHTLAKEPHYFGHCLKLCSNSENGLGVYRAGIRYMSTGPFRHKDSLGRVWRGPEDDRYLSAEDGRLRRLVVQASGEILRGPANSTWDRKGIKECTPTILRIVYSLLGPQTEDDSGMSLVSTYLLWFPSCLLIAALLCIPTDLGGERRNNGCYEQFKYHYWGYSKIPANLHEIPKSRASTVSAYHQNASGLQERLLRPRKLCLLQDEGGFEIIDVSDYEAKHGSIEYLFICYTTQQFSHGSNEDMDELHRMARAAARRAGVTAYWIACSCMPGDSYHSEDIYRISDVVRGSRALVVSIGPSRGSSPNAREMLRQLGSRMWTFPEVLLSPSSQPISIYLRYCDAEPFRTLSKRDFTNETWRDAIVSRQLIDHYEGSIILSPLELVSIALQCFPSREFGEHYPGDLSYALMGLLRRRPHVTREDSAFEAFCRLSLANDSDLLIERLICMLPKDIKRDVRRDWHEIDDFWGCKLWEVEPHCQVVGLGGDDTVILSGAFGAPIRWKSFVPVNCLMRNTIKRWVARVVLRASPVLLIFGAILEAGTRSRGGATLSITVIGWILIGVYLFIMAISPYLIYSLYVGKPWAAQPWLFGFEGYMDIKEIERLIFGIDLGRLKWSPYSSNLSLHDKDEDGECVGLDPTKDSHMAQTVFEARYFQNREPKVFTLVDTNTLTVTLFQAIRPPVAMLLCGSEGGMQRALLCSYDWKSQTLYRESVLRVDTLVLDHMSRVDRFRLGLQKP